MTRFDSFTRSNVSDGPTTRRPYTLLDRYHHPRPHPEAPWPWLAGSRASESRSSTSTWGHFRKKSRKQFSIAKIFGVLFLVESKEHLTVIKQPVHHAKSLGGNTLLFFFDGTRGIEIEIESCAQSTVVRVRNSLLSGSLKSCFLSDPAVSSIFVGEKWESLMQPEAVADVPGSSCEQFADDTNLTSINSRADLTEDNLQVAINQTASWLRVWRLCVNPQKTVIMETFRRALPPLSIELAQDALTKVQSHRHLGVIFSHDIRWNNHNDYILTKATLMLSVLRRLRSSLDQESMSHMHLTYIRPILEYACTAWGILGTTQVDRLERFRKFKGEQPKSSSAARCLCPVTMMNSRQPLAGLPWHQEENISRQFLDIVWPPATFPSTWETTSLPSPPTCTILENYLSSNSPQRTPL